MFLRNISTEKPLNIFTEKILIVACPGPGGGVAEAPEGGGDGQPAVRQLGPRQLRLVQPRLQRGRHQHLSVNI